MNRTTYIVEDETTGETITASRDREEARTMGEMVAEFDTERASRDGTPEHVFMLQAYTLH